MVNHELKLVCWDQTVSGDIEEEALPKLWGLVLDMPNYIANDGHVECRFATEKRHFDAWPIGTFKDAIDQGDCGG